MDTCLLVRRVGREARRIIYTGAMTEHGNRRARKIRPWIVFFVIIAVLGAAAGVGITGLRGGNSGLNAVVGSLRGGRKLEVGLLDEPTSLDIRSNSERSVQQALMGNVYETLVTFNDEQAIASGLAARWAQTTDGLRYTFFLRNGLTFSDGTPLDASSVVRSLQQTLAGDHTNDGLSNITAVENNDARSVTFTLSSPNPRLLPALASQAGAIVNPNAKNPDFAHHSYGSGPFIVNAVQPGSIELTRNEHYWADKPKTSQATLRYYTDERKMADDLKAGKLNVALPRSAHIAEQLSHTSGITLQDGFSTRKTLLALNSKSESPFSDEQVRQFTRYAIDARQIANAEPGAKAQLSGPISQMQPGYVDLDNLFQHDLGKASSMRWYFAADYFKPFNLLADEAHRELAQTLVDQIAAIPMPVSLEVVDSATLNSRVQSGDYTCALIEMDDPHDYTRFVDGSAMFGYVNGTVQQQYRKALEQTDFKDYRAQLREFDRLVSEDAASAWLYTGKDYVAAQNDVQGVDANLAGSRLALAQLS